MSGTIEQLKCVWPKNNQNIYRQSTQFVSNNSTVHFYIIIKYIIQELQNKIMHYH